MVLRWLLAMPAAAMRAALALCVGIALVVMLLDSRAGHPEELLQPGKHHHKGEKVAAIRKALETGKPANTQLANTRRALQKQLEATRSVMKLLRHAPGVGSDRPLIRPKPKNVKEEMQEATNRFATLEDKTMQAAGALYRSFKKQNAAEVQAKADEAKFRADQRKLRTILARRELIRSVYDFDMKQMKREQQLAAGLLGERKGGKSYARTMKKASINPGFAQAFFPEPAAPAEEQEGGEASDEDGGGDEEGDTDAAPGEAWAQANNHPYGLMDEIHAPGTLPSYEHVQNAKLPKNLLDSEARPPLWEKDAFYDEHRPSTEGGEHAATPFVVYGAEGKDLRGAQEPEPLTPLMHKLEDQRSVHDVLPDEYTEGEAERIRGEPYTHVASDNFPHTGMHEARLLQGEGEAGQLDPLSIKSTFTDSVMPAAKVAKLRDSAYYGRTSAGSGEPVSDWLVGGADATNGLNHHGMEGAVSAQ
jgi:hypothetical protein